MYLFERREVMSRNHVLQTVLSVTKSILNLTILVAALYLLTSKTEDGHSREIAMWLLGALMGYWLR
jgi:hypothetical protein